MEDIKRLEILKKFGADNAQADELLRYNQTFSLKLFDDISDELFVPVWEQYITEAAEYGMFNMLQKHFVQFSFPILEGISNTEDYKNATLKGLFYTGANYDNGIILERPDDLSIYMHKTAAGSIPVLFTECRNDFVTLVRTLVYRNEPREIPSSMGACMVRGYNNWDRINRYKKAWEADHKDENWNDEFTRFMRQKELYQDRFIILCNNGYSNVSGHELGLEENEWKRLSVIIRREHECTHYVTQRLFGSARNNAFDELLADCAGITAALGRYDAGWFLRFAGLEKYPEYRKGARLENYKGNPPLSNGAFTILQKLIYQSALNLENKAYEKCYNMTDIIMNLYSLSLEELAAGRF